MFTTSDAYNLAGPNVKDDLAKHCGYALQALNDLAANNPNIRILDVGCGSGTFTIDLAARVGPSGHAVGIDNSASILVTAEARAQYASMPNVRFLKADAHVLPFADSDFDFVYVHQVLTHLTEPVKAIKECLRVLEPGGTLCIREGDLTTARFLPQSSVLDECFSMIRKVHKANGGSITAGYDLYQWVSEINPTVSSVNMEKTLWKCETREDRVAYGGHWPARCLYGAFADKLIELGVKTYRLEQYAQAWRSWIDDPNGKLEMMHGEMTICTREHI